VTTDCVFDGKKGAYNEQDLHTATDVYGLSKSLGEPEYATVVRTSIIGEELSGKLSLLEWVKSNSGKEVNGFTNHYWNGITCLQFAKLCEKIIDSKNCWCGVRHLFSPNSVSKYELVKLISDVFDLNVVVKKFEAQDLCDRTLGSIYDKPLFEIPDLATQLEELRGFSAVLNEKE